MDYYSDIEDLFDEEYTTEKEELPVWEFCYSDLVEEINEIIQEPTRKSDDNSKSRN